MPLSSSIPAAIPRVVFWRGGVVIVFRLRFEVVHSSAQPARCCGSVVAGSSGDGDQTIVGSAHLVTTLCHLAPSGRAERARTRAQPLSIVSSSPPSWSTCSVVCSMPKRSCSIRLELAPDRVAVVVAADEHVRRQRGEAAGDLPDVQVVDLDHAGVRGHRAGRSPATSMLLRRGLEEARGRARSSDQAARSMIAATSSAAIPSAWWKPVARITTAGDGGAATNAARSVSTCWKAPSTLRLRRSAPASDQVATRLTATPTSATTSTGAPWTSGGSTSRRIALVDDQPAEHEQRRAVELRREDLGAPEPVGHRALRRARGEPRGDERERRAPPRR